MISEKQIGKSGKQSYYDPTSGKIQVCGGTDKKCEKC
jgi:hypothetical protein